MYKKQIIVGQLKEEIVQKQSIEKDDKRNGNLIQISVFFVVVGTSLLTLCVGIKCSVLLFEGRKSSQF